MRRIPEEKSTANHKVWSQRKESANYLISLSSTKRDHQSNNATNNQGYWNTNKTTIDTINQTFLI